jgi:hypothetical protein
MTKTKTTTTTTTEEEENVYVLIRGTEWEEIVVILSKEEAIQISKQYPFSRVEIFSKNANHLGYIPTYHFYRNGEYIPYN